MGDKNHDTDVAFIEALASLLKKNELTEIEVMREYGKDDVLNVRVARQLTAAPVAQTTVAVPAAASAPATAASAAAPSAPVTEDPSQHPGAVTSPMVGTAYRAPEPGAANFISVGDKVSEGQTLLIIEAMKTMNQIPAPKSGKVTRIMVEDGSPVEFGDPLVIVE